MAIMLSLLHLLPLLLVPLFFSSLISSDSYAPLIKNFLNCGSESDAKFGLRQFIGDAKPDPLPINPGESKVVKNNSIPKSINEIYQTARVYNRPTWYVFGSIIENGTYVVRLHFFPLSLSSESESHPNLSQAWFNVFTSSGFQLLSNFSFNNRDLEKPIVEEFIFRLQNGIFGIQFSPLESSLAFVNDIEFFMAPRDSKPESAYPVSPQVTLQSDHIYEMASEALRAIYRVTMGGSLVTPDNDFLWRTWLPDDGFLAFPSAAKNVSYNGNIKFRVATTLFTAPLYVYSHAKELNMDSSGHSRDSNLTWVFKVKKNTKYFVRFHWCDIIKQATTFRFDFFLGVNYTWLDSKEEKILDHFATPFRYEFIIVTDGSGYFNVGIARNKDAPSPRSRAFLNGLEIMELIENSSLGTILTLEEKRQEKRNYNLLIIIGASVGGAVIIDLAIGLVLCYFIRRRRKSKKTRPRPLLPPQDEPLERIISMTDLAPNLNLELKISFAEITAATDGFDEKRLIGAGGFGKVYHGTLHDKEVAVKRSSPGFGQGFKEFQTEIFIFSQIRHRHLVTIYGYCNENKEMILVYEYMEGGTLREYLYGSKTHDHHHPPLTWKERLEICIHAAKGLDYLHTGSAAGVIIHLDIKTTNILLDKSHMAKVADFGISKYGVPNTKELYTTIRGTYGYLDPEYFNTGQLTEKSDVYSFGVVLFEVLSGRPPIVQSVSAEEINLADWGVLCEGKGEIEKLIDPFLVGTIEADSLRKFVEVAVMCVNEVGANRPSMHDVVCDLELALQFQFEGV